MSAAAQHPLKIAIVGAGPVGLALALHAAQSLGSAEVTLLDARAADSDVGADPRTLALSLGSVQLLQRLGTWVPAVAEPIREVHVSQMPPGLGAHSTVHLRADELGVPMLGAVLRYGPLVQALQRAWFDRAAREPARLHSAFGHGVTALRERPGAVEVDAGVVQTFDLVVVAEGGVFADPARLARASGFAAPLQHDYGQTAWVGTVRLRAAPAGVAFERFTPQGPVALLPLPAAADTPAGHGLAALVWCVPTGADTPGTLDDVQRLRVLASRLPAEAGVPVSISPLKSFGLGLLAERSLVQGRQVRIGNAAQTLHPVAGQGLNLGLRDAFALVQALRGTPDVEAALSRVQWSRAPDRWTTIATTDFLARSFRWQGPVVAGARALAMAAIEAVPPLKRRLARQMMVGWR